jgi:hypothetical protein
VSRAILLLVVFAAAVAVAASGPAEAAGKARTKVIVKKYRGTPGYGFLPGYEPPGRRMYRRDSTYPWFGWPGYYRGRWNGGGFGPCWTKTPIGMVWNCG